MREAYEGDLDNFNVFIHQTYYSWNNGELEYECLFDLS